MKILEKSDATGSLAEYTVDIEKEPVIVTSDGDTDCSPGADWQPGDDVFEH